MSPPQVNISEKKEKDCESASNEEKKETTPSEKADNLDFSYVVLAETERRAHGHRHGRHHCPNRQRRNRFICGMIFVIIMVVAAAVIIPMALRWRHHKRHHHHHEKFHCGVGHGEYRVDIDHDKEMIHAHKYPEEDMHIIHAYRRRLIAYKKDKDNTCFIDRLDEEFDEGLERWKSYKKRTPWEIKRFEVLSPKPIEEKVLEHVTNVHIFELCRNSQSLFVKEIDIKEVTTAKTVTF